MNTTTPSLSLKLAHVLEALDAAEKAGQPFSFGLVRSMLGKRKIILLPCVKSHHEVTIPSPQGAMDRVRVTVVLEITLVDGESEQQIVSRWVGQAVDEPALCYDRAITHALEDFLKKTFLLMAANDDDEAAPAQPSMIRRRPSGASIQSTQAAPPVGQEDEQEEKPHSSTTQLALPGAAPAQPTPDKPAPRTPPRSTQTTAVSKDTHADAPPQKEPLPALTEAWKASNALWRALVAEVASSEVMNAFEEALEQKHGVDSWRRISTDDIRACCKQLKKRSATTSDIRRISDREEFILTHLPGTPAGSSLTRLQAELERLNVAVVDQESHDAFMALYLEKMSAKSLSEVSGRAVIALMRKIRKLSDEERERFILRALKQETSDAA